MTTYVQNIPRSFTTEHERDTCKTLDRIFITSSDRIFSNMHPSSFTDERLRVNVTFSDKYCHMYLDIKNNVLNINLVVPSEVSMEEKPNLSSYVSIERESVWYHFITSLVA